MCLPPHAALTLKISASLQHASPDFKQYLQDTSAVFRALVLSVLCVLHADAPAWCLIMQWSPVACMSVHFCPAYVAGQCLTMLSCTICTD